MGDDSGAPRSSAEAAEETCPDCGAPLPSGAVLCVNCGYDLKSGYRLQTVVERTPSPAPDDNPYAAPAPIEEIEARRLREPAAFDLTDYGVRRAEAVASAAESMLLVTLFAICLCAPLWLALLPTYAYYV